MYHHAKRPTPLLCGIAGSVCAIGVIAVVARGLDNFTQFTLREPFDTLSYVLAVTCWFAGPAMVGWLWRMADKQKIAELKEENQRLHQQCDRLGEVIEAVRRCDQEVEVVKVKVDKVLKNQEKEIPVGDTQELPKKRLHGIPGGGGA